MKKSGFTLAEVLVTLGIVGVVASLTIPTLIKNYQKHTTVNKLKSVYSIIDNAFERAKVDYGSNIYDWNEITDSSGNFSNYFVDTYFKPYVKTIKDCDLSDDACSITYTYLNGGSITHTDARLLTLANGIILRIVAWRVNANTSRFVIFISLNGGDKHVYGRDTFCVEYDKVKDKFVPYGYSESQNVRIDEYLNPSFSGSCTKEQSGQKCMALIMHDGWTIKDDYPW